MRAAPPTPTPYHALGRAVLQRALRRRGSRLGQVWEEYSCREGAIGERVPRAALREPPQVHLQRGRAGGVWVTQRAEH